MRRILVGGWSTNARCRNGHVVDIYYTLPDYGDAAALYQCPTSGDLFAVSPDAEHYIGPAWEERRALESCPSCGKELQDAPRYPETFHCPVCGIQSHFALHIIKYPSDAERQNFECWDPYS
jgi:hypothetical protein